MKKPKPVRRGTAKKPAPWKPVPVAVQQKQHRIAVRNWKPTPVAVQRKQHQVAVKRAHAKSKVRKLSPGYDVACCAAQAVGTLLGLSDADVLALYGLTAEGPDDGASIEDTLDALRVPGYSLARAHPAVAGECTTALCPWTGNAAPSLILGLELPEGPHAVLATGDGWWSWGDLYDPGQFPGAVIDEAWAVTL